MFTALSTILDSIVTPKFSAGVWYGWSFMLSPISGIMLGPFDGFFSTLLAVMIGHSLVFRETVYEYVFTLGAPISALVSGYVFRGEWRKVFLYYSAMLVFYFLSPVSRSLPLWGMWDSYLAFVTLLVIGILSKTDIISIKGSSSLLFALCAFLGLEADVLFRIFVLVPCQTYRFFYGLTTEALALIWAVPAPLITPFKVALSTIFTALAAPYLNKILQGFQHLY